jgi:hypothetical protein
MGQLEFETVPGPVAKLPEFCVIGARLREVRKRVVKNARNIFCASQRISKSFQDRKIFFFGGSDHDGRCMSIAVVYGIETSVFS